MILLEDAHIRALNGNRPLRINCKAVGLRSGQVPLVLLHGYMECSVDKAGTFRHVIDDLRERRGLILCDMAGHGESGGYSHFTLRVRDQAIVMANAIARVLAAHNLEGAKVDMLGHSLGGGVVSAIVANHADILSPRKIILVDSVGLFFETPIKAKLLGMGGGIGFIASQFCRKGMVTRYKKGLYKEKKNFSLDSALLAYGRYNSMAGRRAMRLTVRRMFQDTTDREWQDNVLALVAKKLPRDDKLVLWGSHDKLLKAEVGRRLAEFVDSPFQVIDDAGHHPMVEKPKEFARIINEFLG